ncbi:MAG: hypothetical protein E7A46_05550 [Finegoldia magna]|uniref:hypothetical protein n=1 Tax=Finegoldia magna TaxID=1260 RepID=UPI0029027021|nr:hypothetical protein [Finegoldia magna]MDU1010542.1 hypothetical protein [Finegoldia magna]MDU1087582.1 hypothetical protein [Finegoldia magna]
MKSKYLSTISKLVYLITLILMFIISKKNIQIQKFTLILIMGINIFSFVASVFLSEISKKLKIGLILALVIFYVVFVTLNMI